MATTTIRTFRAVRAWFTGFASVEEHEIVLDRGDREVPASVFTPRGGPKNIPGWIVLHGITRPGRFHPTLLQFCRALASSGAAVLVPQVPEWKNLRLAPEQSVPTVRAALTGLRGLPETRDGGFGLIGFSFGCAQALMAAAEEELGNQLEAVVGFGGYADLERIMRFQMTGEHEWGGVTYRSRPDPYGRWIIGGNHLTSVPSYADATDVAGALWKLAVEAGERRILAWDPSYDPLKRVLRETVAPERRGLYDLFAPLSTGEPDPERAEAIVPQLAKAALRVSPTLDPIPVLPRIRPDIFLIHGETDNLIPFTETLRLQNAFPASRPIDTTITALFAHSEREGRLTSLRREVRESLKLIGALRRMIRRV
jgi:pimeloyl-ACP methyl ester carboxylesterase